MIFDMETLEAQNRYKILTATVTPRPIAWITTLSASGVINAAPFSFFNVMGHEPPTVAIGLLAGSERFKDTAANILDTGEIRREPGRREQRRGHEHRLHRRAARDR